MNISDLIKKLEEAKRLYGDHPVTTWDGYVQMVKLTPAKDGVSSPIEPGSHNEISLEILT